MESKFIDVNNAKKDFTRGSKEWKELNNEAKELKVTIGLLRERMDVTNMTFDEARRYQKDLRTAMRGLKEDTEEYVASSAKLKEVNTRLAKLNSDFNAVDTSVKKSSGVWTNLKGWIAGAFAVTAIIEFARMIADVTMGVFNITSKFEKYNTVLKNALNSQVKATAAMEMLKEVAATTPFSLDEMTDGFNKMVQRGIIPTSSEIKKLTDLAASQGKEFGQLVEAVLDAQMGEGERLKEFGIKMRKSGDDVSLSFKGQTTTVKNSEKAIYDSIIAMGAYNGVAGITSEVSDKLAGKQSNLGDKIDFIAVKLGEKLKPMFHFILDMFMKGVDIVSDFIDNIGPLGTVVEYIGSTFSGLYTIGRDLFYKLFPSAKDMVFDMGNAVRVLSTVLYAVLVPFQLLKAVVVAAIDSFRVMSSAAGMVWKALKGDFEGAKADAKGLEQSWNALKKNGSDNFGAISNGIKKIWSENQKDIKTDTKSWDEWAKEIKANQGEVTNNADKNSKEQEKIKKKSADEILKAHKDMLKKISEANELADKNIRKSLADNVKAIKANNADELKANEKLQDELRENALKLAGFKDAVDKLDRIKKATSLKEIEQIENEYSDRSLKRELENSRQKLAIKEREFKLLNDAGILYKEEEDRRSAEILKLRGEVADKELAIVKKGIKDKQDKLKEDADWVKTEWDKEVEAFQEKTERKKQLEESLNNAIVDGIETVFSFFNEKISKKLDEADNAMEKFRAEQEQKDMRFAQNSFKGVMKLASGDLAGGLTAIGASLSVWVYEQVTLASRTAEAYAQLGLDRMKRQVDQLVERIDEVNGKLASVAEIYKGIGDVNPFEGIGDVSVTLGDLYEALQVIVPNITGLAERGEKSGLALLDSEMKIGEQIQKNYDQAVAREEQLHQEILSNIQTQYNDAVDAINKKYDIEDARAGRAFTAGSLAIQQETNQQLLALVTVGDTRVSILKDYNQKRADIDAIYADKIKPITAEMSQAEIDGINTATEARDQAYGKIESWLTKELTFVLGNEEQKRQSYTATQKIIEDGEYKTDLLREKFTADEITRNANRNAELLAAQNKYNGDKESEEQRHADTMTRISEMRDKAISDSFERLKNNMISAIDQMQARYAAMVAAGVEGADKLFASLQSLRDMYNSLYGPMTTPLRTDFTDDNNNGTPTRTNVPRFENGGIMKGDGYFENHGVLGGLSHNTPEGGNWVINARTGRIQAKVEAGEWMGIVNKNTTSKYKDLLYTLAKSSVATTGKPVYAENGYFGTPTPVDSPSRTFTPSINFESGNSILTEVVKLLGVLSNKTDETNGWLSMVADSTSVSASKRFTISVNEVIEAADIVADVDSRSRFA
jgi:hypothetical protein